MTSPGRNRRRVPGWAPRAALAALALALAGGPSPAAAQLPGADPACGGPAAERCYREGLEQAQAALGQGTARGAGMQGPVALLLGACDGGVGDGCNIAARLTETSTDDAPQDDVLAAAAAHAVQLFAAGCVARERPSGAACTAAGFHHAGRPRETHLDSALFFLERGCALEEPASCYRLAELTDDWLNPGAGPSAPATRRIQAACDAGSPGACLSAARRRERSLAAASPARRATAAFRRERDAVRRAYAAACAPDALAGCTALGALYAEGRMGLPVNPDSARHYLDPACRGRPGDGVLGHGAACRTLGRMLAGVGPGPADTLPHDTLRVDTAAAVKYMQDGCALLDPEACADLAYHGYRMGAEPAATAFFRAHTTCEAGSAAACRVAGLLARRGAADDPAQGAAYLRRGCDLGDGPACLELADVRDPARLHKYLRRACVLNDAVGCTQYAGFATLGDGERMDGYRALLARGCELGDAEGCRLLLQIQAEAEREVAQGEYRSRICAAQGLYYCKMKLF